MCQSLAMRRHFFVEASDLLGHVDARVLGDTQDHAVGLIFAESGDRHGEVVLSGRHRRGDIFARGVRLELADNASRCAFQRNSSVGYEGARLSRTVPVRVPHFVLESQKQYCVQAGEKETKQWIG